REGVRRSSLSGDDSSSDRAERVAAENDLVAVLQERALVAGQLDQAPRLAFFGARDRPAGEQVAGAERRAVRGQVGDLLSDVPVEVASVRPRDHVAAQLDLERD